MTPTKLHRFAAGFVAAFFLLGGAEHWSGSDPCPHHDAAFVVAGASEADAEHHAHHGDSSQESGSHSEEHGPCDCVGPCATPAPIALPAAASYTLTITAERVEIPVASPRDVAPPQYVPFLLPYAHAPPSLG